MKFGTNIIKIFIWLAVMPVLAIVGLKGPAIGSVTEMGARDASGLIEQHHGNPSFVIIDMRTPAEYGQGHIAGAQLIDYYDPHFRSLLDRLDRNRTYLVYCRSGNRSGKAMKMLKDLGFDQVYHLKGGILDWKASGFPLVKPS